MKRIIFAIALFIYGSFVLYSKFQALDHRFLSLESQYNTNYLNSANSNELEKGEIVKGVFKYRYPSLGQLTVRFNNNFHDSEDVLIFRIKEKGSNSWYYQAKYNTDQFLPHRLFPFGFPEISNSSGKTYEFELESLKGVSGRGISLDKQNPVFIAKSIFSKNELLSNRRLLTYFVVRKFCVLAPYLYLFLFAFSPNIVFYILFYLPPQNPLINNVTKILKNKDVLLIVKILIVCALILSLLNLYQSTDNTLIISSLIIYLLFCSKYRFESRVTLFLSTVYFLASFVFLLFHKSFQANAYSVWGYIFLWITLFHLMAENVCHFHPKMSLGKFLHCFVSFIKN